MEQAAVGFERDIRPLFREKDIDSMRLLSDLSAVPGGQHRRGVPPSLQLRPVSPNGHHGTGHRGIWLWTRG